MLCGVRRLSHHDRYEGRLLIFLGTPQTQQEAERLYTAVMETVAQEMPDAVFCRCSGLQDTADVRTAYLGFREYLPDAMHIYPRRRIYTWGDIGFSKDCRLLVQTGEAALAACLDAIAPVQTDSDELDLAETMSVYLLDAEMSVTRTSELLHIHKNTVKYRSTVFPTCLAIVWIRCRNFWNSTRRAPSGV